MFFLILWTIIASLTLAQAVQDIPTTPFVACWNGDKECSTHLPLSGQMIFQNRPPNKNNCESLSSIILFAPDTTSTDRLNHVLFYNGDHIKINIKGDENLYQTLTEHLPTWYKEGLMGEVRFYVTGDFYDLVPASMACDGGWVYAMQATNIEIVEKNSENLSNKRGYSHIYGDSHPIYERIVLDSSDPFVNIHKTPNGEILAKIQASTQNDGFMYRLDGAYSNIWNQKNYPIDFGNNTQASPQQQGWARVIFFPPHENSSEKAIIGYIEESNIKEGILSLESIKDFQKIPRPIEPPKPPKESPKAPPTPKNDATDAPKIIRTPY